MQGMVFNKLGGGMKIKSIQRIALATTAFDSALVVNSTISVVDMSKTFCLFSQTIFSNSENSRHACSNVVVRLTSSTNVEASVQALSYKNGGYIYVVEFDSGVTVQRGVTSSTVITITSVDPAKSFCTLTAGGTSTTNATAPMVYPYLYSATSLRIGGYASYITVAAWEVVTFS